MKVVVDSSVAIDLAIDAVDFDPLHDHDVVAPTLLWSEATAAIHLMHWRGEISAELAEMALNSIEAAPIEAVDSRTLLSEAWWVAERLGWARTYDAEFVALARRLNCPLLTLDRKLQRGASRVIDVIGPRELS